VTAPGSANRPPLPPLPPLPPRSASTSAVVMSSPPTTRTPVGGPPSRPLPPTPVDMSTPSPARPMTAPQSRPPPLGSIGKMNGTNGNGMLTPPRTTISHHTRAHSHGSALISTASLTNSSRTRRAHRDEVLNSLLDGAEDSGEDFRRERARERAARNRAMAKAKLRFERVRHEQTVKAAEGARRWRQGDSAGAHEFHTPNSSSRAAQQHLFQSEYQEPHSAPIEITRGRPRSQSESVLSMNHINNNNHHNTTTTNGGNGSNGSRTREVNNELPSESISSSEDDQQFEANLQSFDASHVLASTSGTQHQPQHPGVSPMDSLVHSTSDDDDDDGEPEPSGVAATAVPHVIPQTTTSLTGVTSPVDIWSSSRRDSDDSESDIEGEGNEQQSSSSHRDKFAELRNTVINVSTNQGGSGGLGARAAEIDIDALTAPSSFAPWVGPEPPMLSNIIRDRPTPISIPSSSLAVSSSSSSSSSAVAAATRRAMPSFGFSDPSLSAKPVIPIGRTDAVVAALTARLGPSPSSIDPTHNRTGGAIQVGGRMVLANSALARARTRPRCAEWTCARQETGTETFLRCGRCLAVTYCSSTCQKSHWKQHKPNCTPPQNDDTAAAASTVTA
jgi:hypothetical protein